MLVEKDVWIEGTYDYDVASGSLKGKISQMEVVEDFESRPHKVVSSVVERGKEIKEWSEKNLPKVLAAWLQWRKIARKEHKRERQRRR